MSSLHTIVQVDTDDSVIPGEIREVIALFDADGPLTGVGFPGVDSGAFGELLDDVHANADCVAEARQLLAAAREDLHKAHQALAKRATVAVSYARVFGEGDPDLTSELEELMLSKREKQRQKRTRRRRRKPASAPDESPPEPVADKVAVRTVELPLVAVG